VRAKRTQLDPKPPNEVSEEELQTNPDKYAKRPKQIGRPTVGRPANYVETVGIGSLKTLTAHGNLDG
jgi:hypothetical protein